MVSNNVFFLDSKNYGFLENNLENKLTFELGLDCKASINKSHHYSNLRTQLKYPLNPSKKSIYKSDNPKKINMKT
jgi:hypothetical protein